MTISNRQKVLEPPVDFVPDSNAQRKVVRWELWREVSIFDHKCDKLPEGMKFYKFRFEPTSEEQDAFVSEGCYEREVVCPYCGKHIVYAFINFSFTCDSFTPTGTSSDC